MFLALCMPGCCRLPRPSMLLACTACYIVSLLARAVQMVVQKQDCQSPAAMVAEVGPVPDSVMTGV